MSDHVFDFHGHRLHARPSGALWWPDRQLLCVADLHLGKAERMARRSGAILPPYESQDTLARLEAEISATGAECIVCLGDSFDDDAAVDGLDTAARDWLDWLANGRDWIWIAGNHDRTATGLFGRDMPEVTAGGVAFRHIATRAVAEVSGHYHPKMRLATKAGRVARRCFLIDTDRIVLPAFGTYTGGLETTHPILDALMVAGAYAVLIGRTTHAVPMPRAAPDRAAKREATQSG